MFSRNILRVRPIINAKSIGSTWSRNFVILRKNPALYGHLVQTDPRLRLSLSKDPEATYIGTIPESSVSVYQQILSAVKDEDSDEEPIRLSHMEEFLPNKKFLDVVQKTIKRNIHNCPIFSQLAAAEQGDDAMYFHIYDLRAPPPYGRIAEVEDIVGTVRIEKGKIIIDSYEPNLMYRVLTPNGIFTVSDYLNEEIRKECEKLKSN